MNIQQFKIVCERIATGVMEPENAAQYLEDLGDDRQRKAMFCQAISENYRRLWYEGQQTSRDKLFGLPTKSLQAQYGKFSAYDRKFIADRLWVSSPREAELRGSEQMWSRWAAMFAATTLAATA